MFTRFVAGIGLVVLPGASYCNIIEGIDLCDPEEASGYPGMYTVDEIRRRFPEELQMVSDNFRGLLISLFDASRYQIDPLRDDPRGKKGKARWIWKAASRYAIAKARGDLARFKNGTLWVLGPAESEVDGYDVGVAFLFVPKKPRVVNSTSPLVHTAPGADGVLGTDDDLSIGVAWGGRPEAP